MKYKRILVANPFGIGDVLFTTPLIRALRENFPDSFIAYVCNKRTKAILDSNPNLNEVFVFEKDDYRELWRHSKIGFFKAFIKFLLLLKEKKIDLAIDLSLSFRYSFFFKLIGVRERIGLNFKNRGTFLTKKINITGFHHKHIVDYYLELLKPLSLKMPEDKSLEMLVLTENNDWAKSFLSENKIKDTDLLIGIIPGGGASWGEDASFKHWAREGFAKVADTLIERYNARIILFGDSEEIKICDEIQHLMGKRSVMACGKTSLGEFAALLARCTLVISNDGGPLHVAVSQNVKTVSIFGPVDEGVYGPYPSDSNHIVVTRNIKCRPCYKNFKYSRCKGHDCLKLIREDDILKPAEKLLKN